MDITSILTGVIVLTLLYLHVKQSHLIFVHDIKLAKNITLVLLGLMAVGSSILAAMLAKPTNIKQDTIEALMILQFLVRIANWGIIIYLLWLIMAGCYKDSYWKQIDEPGQNMRDKVKGVLLDVIERNIQTDDFVMLTRTRFDEPDLEKIRERCKMLYYGPDKFSDSSLEKLRDMVEMLEKKD